MRHPIVVEGLSKKYRTYHLDRPLTLQEVFQRGLRRLRPSEEFWALLDVSLKVSAGETLGVIGPNGSGKSTLLRLVGGIGRPDVGRVEVHGRVSALFELGAGFTPDLTGRENVFISGVIGGLTRRQVRERFDAIVGFSELEEFIDSPLRTYSSGMYMRLAFAIAAHIEPEILLIDEVLAVGDLKFQRKCIDRIRQFKTEGCTTLLVSHDLDMVRELCDEVLWLRRGHVVAQGPPRAVVQQYVESLEA